jgi:dTDP-4-dehydrorhamnose reductase
MLGGDLIALWRGRHQVLGLTRSEADITDADLVTKAIACREPDIVVHTAAFTAVDDCESQPERAFK